MTSFIQPLVISAGGVSCLFEHLERDRVQVTLEADGLRASAPVDGYHLGVGAYFLNELALLPSGWSDKKAWQSMEGELFLNAFCDRTGHVALTVTLGRVPNYANWSASICLQVTLGQIPDIAKRLTAFEQALFGAA